MANNLFEDALAAEGVTGRLADVARSIYRQESGSGKNTKTSNAGATGGMQILPGTFAGVADPGWNIKDPMHNARAGIRYLSEMSKIAGGDPALTAAGYYGGPVGLEKARRGIAVSDPRNPNAPTTLQYGAQVAARVPKASAAPTVAAATPVVVAQAAPVPATTVQAVAPVAPLVQAQAPTEPLPQAVAQPDAYQTFLDNYRAAQAPVQPADLAYGEPKVYAPPEVQRPDFMAALGMLGQNTNPSFRPFGSWKTRV